MLKKIFLIFVALISLNVNALEDESYSNLENQDKNIENTQNNEENVIDEEVVEENKNEKNMDDSRSYESAEESSTITPSVFYKAHVQDIGWQDYVSNGKMSGTSHKSKRMESFQIYIDDAVEGSILYKSHIQDIGWESSWKKDNEMTGTSHQSKRLEAIRIRLDGQISELYDVYYRVHAQDYGWLGWAKNGEVAGSLGYSRRLEAIEIKLVEKGKGASTGDSYRAENMAVKYQSHIESIGWQKYVSDGNLSGTTKKSLRIEAIRVKIAHSLYSGGIRYMSYIEGQGWEKSWKANNSISGTTKKSLRIEAIKMSLIGEIYEYYDIYYRVHIRDYGWLGWAKNGEIAGNIDTTFRIEAIQVKLVEKGKGETTGNSNIEKGIKLYYSSYIESLGQLDEVNENEISGTTGKELRLESFKVRVDSKTSGNILYQSYVEGNGWEESWKNNNEYSGTSHQSKAVNLIKIKLDGDLANKYDIYYRVHAQNYGWLGWAKNGEIAGATYYDIQAIQIHLYLKNDSEKQTLNTKNHYVVTGFYTENGYTYYKDKSGNNANDWITIMNEKYFFNSKGIMIGKNVKKVIDVSSWQKDIDWDTVKKYGDIDGVILRIGAGCDEDEKLERNIKQLKRLGLPYGIYIYSYAEDYSEGREYANFTIKMLKKYSMNPKIGIFLDLENNKYTSSFGVNEYTNIVKGYMEVMINSGYGLNTKIYTYKNYAETSLNSDYLKNQITWIAQYNHFCTYSGSYVGWQYSSTEKIPGIIGDVDVSVWFTSF